MTLNGTAVPLGKYQVSLAPPPLADSRMKPGGVLPTPSEIPGLPKKYLDSQKSGLTAEVKEGENEFNFDLKK
jgi:hypothetical protein